MMLLAVLSGFLLAVAVPALYRVAGKHIGWVLALLPALLTERRQAKIYDKENM